MTVCDHTPRHRLQDASLQQDGCGQFHRFFNRKTRLYPETIRCCSDIFQVREIVLSWLGRIGGLVVIRRTRSAQTNLIGKFAL